jgi:hypothetical protein
MLFLKLCRQIHIARFLIVLIGVVAVSGCVAVWT